MRDPSSTPAARRHAVRGAATLTLCLAAALGLSGTTQGRQGDRDRDGLGDRIEITRYRTSPARRDTDRDRLSDGDEIRRYKTNPRRKDTDRDRLGDGDEIRRYKTNPRRKDTDRDGLSDGDEIRRYKTNPRRKDTDRDGLSDGDEQAPDAPPGAGGADPPPPAGGAAAPGIPPTPTRPIRACTAVVSSAAAAEAAVAAASAGAVVCLADGEYGKLRLAGRKDGEVVLQAANPGRATIDGANVTGAWLTLSGLNVTSDVDVQPASEHITIEYNRISGGYFGVNAGPTDKTDIADTTIRGNRFVGPFGEDAIRINRYHDGADIDPYGILVEGNEITGVRENGNHSDCLQSVWGGDHLYFRRNYLHDNRCQGFFVKDQPAAVDTVVVEDNLFLRNGAPCDPPGSGCGQPSVWQVFGPTAGIVLRRNTVWTPEGGSPLTFREGPWGPTTIADNVIYRAWSDWAGAWPGYAESGNVVCKWEGRMPPLSSSSRRTCTPAFAAPASDDYRLSGTTTGVSWRPADQPYGP